ncbi:hypothetical protein ACOMHN_009579 [Nucella lapillus]
MTAALLTDTASASVRSVTAWIPGNVSQDAGSSACLELQTDGQVPWDHPDSLVSARTEDLVRRARDTIVLPILFVIGGPANVINMAVFRRQGLGVRINVCLFCLSLADLLYLANNMLLYGEQIHVQHTTGDKYGPIMRFLTNHNLLGMYGFTWVSEVLSALIATERCFCVLWPLRAHTVLSARTATVIIVIVNVTVVGLYFFVTARYRLVCAYDPLTGANIWTFTAGPFYRRHQRVIDFLDAFVYGLGIPLVTMVIVALTTGVTLVKLRQAAAWRAGRASRGGVSASDVALTMMLVYNSVFFCVCVCPVALFRVVWLFIPDMNAGGRQHNLFFTCIWLMDMVTYVNATFNIAVYYTMGSRYRQTFWQILGRPGASATKHTHSSNKNDNKPATSTTTTAASSSAPQGP